MGALKDGFFVAALTEELREFGKTDWSELLKTLGDQLEKHEEKNGFEKLIQEYTNLFIHPASTALPYQTEYTASHEFMKSQQLADIMGFYRAFRLDLSETEHERADFIVTELEFMHYLCLKEAQARKQYFGHIDLTVETEKKFLEEHLGAWVKEFYSAMVRSGQSEIYTAILSIASRFVNLECKQFGIQLEVFE